MKASRELTQAALRIFLSHFLSFPWLRKYLVDARIRDCLADFRLEKGYTTYKSEEFDILQSSQHILDASYHLMFLTRLASQWFPTAELLSKISVAIQLLLESSSTPQTFLALDSVYFLIESTTKARRARDTRCASLWGKVSFVPLCSEAFYRYYLEAKGTEMSLLVDCDEDQELFETLSSASEKSVVESWIAADIRYRREVEKKKSLDDLMKYCESISAQERNNGFSVISYFWDEFMRKERVGESSARDLLMAWALQNARDCSLRSDNHGTGKTLEFIWNFAITCLEKGVKRLPSNQFHLAIRLARRTEELLNLLTVTVADLESFNQLFLLEPSVWHVNHQAVQLMELLRKKICSPLQTIDESNAEKLRKIVFMTADALRWQLFDVLKMFRTIIERKQQLVLKFAEYPHLVDILQTRLNQFLDDMLKFLVYFQDQIRDKENLSCLELQNFRRQFPLLTPDGENGVSHCHLLNSVDDFPFFDCNEMKEYSRKAAAAEESEDFQLQRTTTDGDERIPSVYSVIMKHLKVVLTALCERSPIYQKKLVEDSQVYWNQIRVILALPEKHRSNDERFNRWERRIVNEFVSVCFQLLGRCVSRKCVDNIGKVTEKLVFFLSDCNTAVCTEAAFSRWMNVLTFMGNFRYVGQREFRMQKRIFEVSFAWLDLSLEESHSLSPASRSVEESRLFLENAVQLYAGKHTFWYYLVLIKDALSLEDDWLTNPDYLTLFDELSHVELTDAMRENKEFQGLLDLLQSSVNKGPLPETTPGRIQLLFRCLLHACKSVVMKESTGMLYQWKELIQCVEKHHPLPALEEYLEIVLLFEKTNWATMRKPETLATFCQKIGFSRYPEHLEEIRQTKIKALMRKSAEVAEEIRDLQNKCTDPAIIEENYNGKPDLIEMKSFAGKILDLTFKYQSFISRGRRAQKATDPEIVATETVKQQRSLDEVKELLEKYPKLKEIVGEDPLK